MSKFEHGVVYDAKKKEYFAVNAEKFTSQQAEQIFEKFIAEGRYVKPYSRVDNFFCRWKANAIEGEPYVGWHIFSKEGLPRSFPVYVFVVKEKEARTMKERIKRFFLKRLERLENKVV